MQSSWSLRRVAPSDADQVAAHGCFREDDAERRPGYAAWVKPRIGAGAYVGWFAVEGGEVVAGAGVVLLDWGPTRLNPGGQMARITNVFTAATHRRQGIARTLVATALDHLKTMGIGEVRLGATDDARELYRSLGFEAYPAEMRRKTPG
ncbi:GNAT family N-acetyltransferase [Roseateles chitinivorans]|uniref:GNAT family N-acetyltransferase n=1 Tax=Roseateles chitinivorans TaxID=2917965 RepID=UPI003D67A57F